MLDRLLIANRGEIACRVARTADRLGVGTVGVYSEPDRNALHVDAMDVAVALGGATPTESYLRGDAIIAAALATGCDAIHPGYGFLAENAAFAQAVIDAGLVWVGPTPAQIELLGDKVAAKRVALEAGVPTTPIIEMASLETASLEPGALGYPLLVKAAAGGGGRGMRIVRSPDELPDAVAAARREAQSAFGDGTVFLEPYIERGRHVEVQILGDAHGNVLHLGERECSIQRRNQKVVEESPSPGISDDVRRQLHAGALALAHHVGYQSAGTVEFMVGERNDGEPTIAFLEVNTRLQVEHPVTESVTGLDLVELQLRVAAGERLTIEQRDVAFAGHAIEVRVVAEDPAQGWLPSTGTVTAFDLGATARVDAGMRAGSVVSSDYDSLLAKVIHVAPTRREAARQLARVLRRSQIAGVRTNLDTLVAILEEPDFLAGDTPTTYLDEHPDVAGAGGLTGDDLVAHLLAVTFADEQRNRAIDGVTGFAASGWRNLRTVGQRRTWMLGDARHEVEYELVAGSATARVGPWPVPGPDGTLAPDARRTVAVRLIDRAPHRQVLELDGVRRAIDVALSGDEAISRSPAGSLAWTRAPRFADHDAESAGSGPVCPLPGTVIAVHVTVGEEVRDGAVLMVVEAMKMEHKITAHSDAVVREVRYAAGDRVDAGDLLVVLDVIE